MHAEKEDRLSDEELLGQVSWVVTNSVICLSVARTQFTLERLHLLRLKRRPPHCPVLCGFYRSVRMLKINYGWKSVRQGRSTVIALTMFWMVFSISTQSARRLCDCKLQTTLRYTISWITTIYLQVSSTRWRFTNVSYRFSHTHGLTSSLL